MPSEPRWLSPADVVELNQLIVADTGEPFFLRSQALLEGALDRPVNLYHYEGQDDVVDLAVLLMCSIAQAHAFEQETSEPDLKRR